MPDPDPNPNPDPKPDPAKELETLRSERDALKAERDALKAAAPKPEPDLGDKARATRDAAAAEAARAKKLENALRFDLSAKDFLKANAALLPEEVASIFEQAEKEKFDDPVDKDSALKSGIVQSFFAQQANVDLLTPGQKRELDGYLKLTKNEKQARAQSMYEMIFEPALETLKRVKRAEALQKGHGSGDDDSFKKKMIASSRQHYFGEKNA